MVNGGSGSDRVFAGSGNDEAIYNMAENENAWDYYSGGRGHDTLTLEFTADEWAQADVKADIDAFLQALEDQAGYPSWWHRCTYFQFSAFDLEGRVISVNFETVAVQSDAINQTSDVGNVQQIAIGICRTVQQVDG